MSYIQNFMGASYPIHSAAEIKDAVTPAKPPTGVDLYARFALAGACLLYTSPSPRDS